MFDILKFFLILIIVIIVIDVLLFMLYSFNLEKIHSPHRYDTILAESPPVSTKHQRNIERGKDIASKSTVVICCLCRDNEKFVALTRKRLEILGRCFKDYNIVIFENDSKDRSRELIRRWCEDNSKVELMDCSKSDLPTCQFDMEEGYMIEHGDRIKNMCFFRNYYLERVKDHYSHRDYTIIYDFDLEGGFLLSGIYDSLGREEEWDGIFANARTPLPPFGCMTTMYDGLAFVKNEKCSKDTTTKRFWDLAKLCDHIGDPLIPVMSAFNGMGIYKTDSIITAEYDIPEAPMNCEHIGLHKNMRSQGCGRFYINPSMLLYVGIQGPQNKFAAIKLLP